MEKQSEKNRLEALYNIIEVIDQAERKIRTLQDTKVRCEGLPTIGLSLSNRIDTLEKVIVRLNKCYNKTLNK